MSKWNIDNIGDQSGRIAIVTGANSGIGFETAKALAQKHAHVVLACRSAERGQTAVEAIRAENADADIELLLLDLASLDSVKTFAETVAERFDRLDLLINNAGVMMPPKHSTTSDGFELQIGINHLGHFALTARLLPLLQETDGSRIVTVSSLAHKGGKIDFDDLNWKKRRYKKFASYGQSKLANLLFTHELQRRLEAAGSDTQAFAAHPGWTGTNLQRDSAFIRWMNPLFAMKPWQGALPSLYAATAKEVEAGGYYGPGGVGEVRGYPKRVGSTSAARNPETAAKLWEVSEGLVGFQVEFD